MFLTDGSARITKSDGSTAEAEYAAGDVVWAEASEHTVLNLGEETVEAIIVELKR